MEKFKLYSFVNLYEEGGFSKSFTLPDDCDKIIGVFLLPQFQEMKTYGNHPFPMGKVSVLFNNKSDNSIHDYPLYCFATATHYMANDENYSFHSHQIKLQTKIDKGSVVTFVYKDSGYMDAVISANPITYGSYNPGLDIYLVYEDSRGDWSNNEFDKDLNKFMQND